MSLHVVPASDWSAEALAACFTAAFDGYLAGSFVLDAATLPRFMARQGADLALSRCVVRNGDLLGLAFVGEYAKRRRVGGMGVLPQARGSGASRLLLHGVVDDARELGLDALELEVFAQNAAALRLYRSFGFIEGAPLWGFVREPINGVHVLPAAPRSVSRDDAVAWLLAQGPDDLPYQVSGHALPNADPRAQIWQIGEALMVFSEAPEHKLSVTLLFDADPAQRDAARLLNALLHRHPQHTVRVPQLIRDDVGGQALRDAGFRPLELHQLQMRLPLR